MKTIEANKKFIFKDAVGRKHVAILTNNTVNYGLDHYNFSQLKEIKSR